MTRVLFAVAFLALVPRLFGAFAIPLGAGPGDPNGAPDEAEHLAVVRELSEGRVPSWPAMPLPYAAFLPTSYAAQALSLAALETLGADRPVLYRRPPLDPRFAGFPLARAGSVALGVVGVVLLAAAAGRLSGSRALALASGAAAALHPQLAFVGSYVNGDVMTAAAGAGLVYALARWQRLGEGNEGLSGVGVASGLVLLGKPNGFALLPATALWALWAALTGRLSRRAAVRASLAALLVSGLLLAWNAARNHGDVFGTRAFRDFHRERPWLTDARSLAHPIPGFVEWFTKSAFGVFGNMDAPLPRPFYPIAATFLGAGLLAALLALRNAPGNERRTALWLASGVLVNLGLAIHMSWFVNFQPQGRYALLPAVLLTLVAIAGPVRLFRHPARWLWPALYSGFLGVAAVAAAAVIWARGA